MNYQPTPCARNELLTQVDDGTLDARQVLLMFCKWSTSDDINEMLDANEISLFEDGRWHPDYQEDENDDDEDDEENDE